ncbi:LemA family protein [Vibrio sp. Hal054]|uniref:LemA family protein n=1 Tax=Vibrio sp. Hal054 TaxID=3035158 RepID=UPI00301D496D
MNNFYILLAVLAFVGLIAVAIHNGIIKNYNRVKQAWADVLTQERAKTNIIPKVEQLAKEYKEFEQDLLQKVTKLREAIDVAGKGKEGDVDKIHNIHTASDALSKGLKVAVEAYPELKANTMYLQLANEIAEQEENVAAAIRMFNSNVAVHNTSIETFPSSLVNASFTKKTSVKSFEYALANLGFSPELS